jgi:hypothetical protein
MKAFTATMLAAFLVAVLLVAPSTAAFPRRVLLDVASCEKQCQDTYETNVKKCISDTQLGKPPPIEKKAAEATDMMTLAYVPPEKTGRATATGRGTCRMVCMVGTRGRHACMCADLSWV